MNTTPAPIEPNPLCSFQGAYLSLLEVQLKLGPFTLNTHPGLGLGHSVDQTVLDGVPVTTLRSAKRNVQPKEGPAPSGQMALGYKQNGTPWLMAFTIITDPAGGLVGSRFSLDVQSSYPDLKMSIGQIEINQPKLVVQKVGYLPADYLAQLQLNFWAKDPDTLPIDAWVAVQVGFLRKPDSPTLAAAIAAGDLSGEELVNTYELLYYPASGDANDAPVLGNNYPAADRHARA
ncbi:hypothetical protein [Stenotrophomonas sp. AB1(2024)]|jgi:hypothetical protein|uniref:hypothetical protein n=1 Tax=Stenotrophomonas sp. AB1(2024) TaxID=3132215 RepID=UPI003097224D